MIDCFIEINVINRLIVPFNNVQYNENQINKHKNNSSTIKIII